MPVDVRDVLQWTLLSSWQKSKELLQSSVSKHGFRWSWGSNFYTRQDASGLDKQLVNLATPAVSLPQLLEL